MTSAAEKRKNIIPYFSLVWLPFFLVIFFVVENYSFNIWTNLDESWLLRSSLATLGLGTILYGPSVFMKYKTRHIYLFLMSLAVGLIFFSQFLYFSYSGGFLQASSLKYVGQLSSVKGTIGLMMERRIIIFFLVSLVPVFSFFWHKNNQDHFQFPRKIKIGFISLLVVITFFSYGFVIYKEKKEAGDIRGLYSRLFNTKELVEKIGVANYYFEDLIRIARASNYVNSEDKKSTLEWLNNHPSPEINKEVFGVARNRNLIVIQVESLENFVIDRKIDNQEITPNLNKLKSDGLYFSNYYYQAGPGTTADAEFSVTNSLFPLQNFVAFFEKPNNTYFAFPKSLKNNGYETAVMHADVPSFWNRNNIYPNLGYSKIFSSKNFSMPRVVNLGLNKEEGLGDEDFLEQSAEIIKNLNKPFAATLLTLTSHTPFEIPEDLKGLKISDKQGLSDHQINYLQTVNYTDKAIGKFITKLKSSGLYNNSIIVIYGDHKSFTSNKDDKGFANFLGLSSFDDLTYLKNSQVPLIVLIPETDIRGKKTIPASHLDLYPTLAHLLGIEVSKGVLGQDLLSTKNPVVTQRANNTITNIVTPSLVYINSNNGNFLNGHCYKNNVLEDINLCEEIYNQQTNLVKNSDNIILGNLFKFISK